MNHSNLPPSLSSPAPSHFSPHSGNDDDKGDDTILRSDSVDQKDVHIKHEPLGQDVLVGGFVGNGTTKDPYPLISMSSAVATPSNLGQLTPQIPLCARVQRSSLRLMRDRYSSVGHLCVVIREVLMQLCKETSNSVDGVAVKWEAAIDGNVLALCKFPLGFQPEQRSQLMLTSPTHHQFNKCGRVTHYEDGYTAVYVEDCVALKLDGFPSSLTTTACPDVDVYARALEGVRRFDAEDECMDVQIRAKFLGVVVPQYLVAPTRLVRSRMVGGTSPLNPMQSAAVNAAQGSFTLIRGPPGTGKSSVSACIIQSWLKGHSGAPCTIVSAQQNKAVDRIAIELLKHGVKLVRVMARQAYCDPLLAAVTLDSLSHTQESDREEMRRLLALRQVQGALPVKLHQKLLHLQREAKKATIAALEGCDVVCCTCSTALDPRLSHLRFRNVLIDEATQVPEFELLMPCTMGCVRLALVGDPAQLGPYVGNQGSVRERTGVGVSTFERLLRMGEPSHLLDIQYRMHPSIAQHPSTEFYGGSLHSAPGLGERCRPFPCSLWDVDRPITFVEVEGSEQKAHFSFCNPAEVLAITEAVGILISAGYRGEQVSVITFYRSQVQELQSALRSSGARVGTVDSFQGQENAVVLLSCVRSVQVSKFLTDYRRLCVAFTRAQCGLVVFGNSECLKRNEWWVRWLTHVSECGTVLNGLQGTPRVSANTRSQTAELPSPPPSPPAVFDTTGFDPRPFPGFEGSRAQTALPVVYTKDACEGCDLADRMTGADVLATTSLGMGAKEKHIHCHRCNGIFRQEHTGACSCCGHIREVSRLHQWWESALWLLAAMSFTICEFYRACHRSLCRREPRRGLVAPMGVAGGRPAAFLRVDATPSPPPSPPPPPKQP